MLARGFALDFKGIDVVLVYNSHLESCMCNVILMVSAIDRFSLWDRRSVSCHIIKSEAYEAILSLYRRSSPARIGLHPCHEPTQLYCTHFHYFGYGTHNLAKGVCLLGELVMHESFTDMKKGPFSKYQHFKTMHSKTI